MTLDRDTLVALAHAIADVLEKREAGSPEPPPPQSGSKKRKPARKRAPAPVRPAREPSELDRARARAELRRLGYVVKP